MIKINKPASVPLNTFLNLLYSIRIPFFIFLISRIVIILAGAYSLPVFLGFKYEAYQNIFISMFSKWDAGAYMDIATKGYSYNPLAQSNVVWFPLYPYLGKILNIFIQNINISLLLLSNTCFLLALITLFNITKNRFGEDTALRTCLYISIFPTAFFYSCAYTESLFLLTLVAAFYFAEKNNWLLVGVIGLLSSMTRMVGIGLFFAMGLYYLELNQWDIRKTKINIA